MKITYLKGDATEPIGEGKKIIVHICNDIGAWGAGFVLALSKKWSQPKMVYNWLKHELGNVHYIPVTQNIMVANMIAQHDIKHIDDIPPIRYDALKTCLTDVNKVAMKINATIHMPRIGCGLGGGKWEEVQKIIEEILTVDVYVYDLK